MKENIHVYAPIKVLLTADLTKYHPGLTPGVVGYTIGEYGEWSKNSSRFVGVCFPGIHTLDVVWDQLEIIDNEQREHIAIERQKNLELLKSAKRTPKPLRKITLPEDPIADTLAALYRHLLGQLATDEARESHGSDDQSQIPE